MDREPTKSRGSGWGPGPEQCQTWPEGSGAERKPEKLEDLVANEGQDADPASESGRRVRDVGSEAGKVGLVAAASGGLWHQGQEWPWAVRSQET